MIDNEEFFTGCRCTGGTHPDCDKHQPITLDRLKAQAEVAEFLKKREEAK